MKFPSGSEVKNLPAMQEPQETWVQTLGWEEPLGRAWWLTPVSLHGESHGQGRLEGYNPQGCKELDTTKVTWHMWMKLSDSGSSDTEVDVKVLWRILEVMYKAIQL